MGSLRQVILNADAITGGIITFDVSGTIQPDSALPTITSGVTIDGTSAPGYTAGSPTIAIDGTNAGIGVNGITIGAGGSGSTVEGLDIVNFNLAGIDIAASVSGVTIEKNIIGADLSGTAAPNGTGIEVDGSGNTIGGAAAGDGNVISGNSGDGIDLGGSGSNIVEGNSIGTNAAGTLAVGNGNDGILIESGSTDNTIGGATAADGNVISGNSGNGVDIDGASSNTVEGNLIGTNAAGTAALGNGNDGILIESGSTDNTIGGPTAGDGNVISGNIGNGIEIGASDSNTVEGNFIGTNEGGTAALGNGTDGILIADGTSNVTIGGTAAGAANVVSGNAGAGIDIEGGSTELDTIEGNLIGTNAAGTAALGNGTDGILIDNATKIAIGGTSAGDGNTIADNAGAGVSITGGNENTIEGNSISQNAIGIDLGVGGNDAQSAPVLTGVVTSGTQVFIDGSLTSTANTTFRIEFFANTGADTNGNYEGKVLLGFENVTTNGSGNASFSATLSANVALNEFVTATATSAATSDTSEFSAGLEVLPPVVTVGTPAPAFNGGRLPVTLDSGIAVSDPDSATLASATVTIGTGAQPGDLLSFNNGTNTETFGDSHTIAASYSGGVLTLTGTASVADYQTALSQVQFGFNPSVGGGTAVDPTAAGTDLSRGIAWQVSDGFTLSATTGTTTSLTVNHTAPTVTAGGTATFDGGGSAVTLDGTLSVGDVDSGGNLTGASVEIASGFNAGDTLNFTNQNGITGSYDAVHGILTLSGTASVAHYQTALDSIAYSFSPTNGDPTAGGGDTVRTISWTVTDGSASNNLSNAATSTLDTVHVAPTATAGGTATFTGGGSAVTLDGTVSLGDVDSSGTLAGATVSIGAGFLNGDTLNFATQNGITGSYDAVHGVLTLTGSASIANYQIALDSVTYSFSPSNGDPTNGGGDTSRTVSWTVTDGNSSHGTSAASTSTLDTVHVAPTVTAGSTVTDETEGPAVTADGAITVTDPDSGNVLVGATVHIASGFASGDVLTVNTTGLAITANYDAASGTLTLSGTDTLIDYQHALQSVAFSSTGTSGGPRTLNWTVDDGAATASATSTVDVELGPQVTAGGTATFHGGGWAVTLDGALTVSDPANANFSGATVSISADFLTGDTLNFANQNGITGSYDAVHGILTLTGIASVADYRIALDSITYSFSPTNGDPTAGGGDTSRTVTWTVHDVAATSAAATSTLHTVHVAPTVTAGGTATFDGGGAAVTLDGTLSLADVDSGGNLAGATVSVSAGFLAGDTLNFTNQHGIAGSYDAAHGVLTLTGTSSVANYRIALDSITYSFSPTNGDPTAGGGDTSRTVTWTVHDVAATSAAATSTLHTVHVAPTVTAGGTATFDGGGAAVTLDGTLSLADVDSGGNLAGATVSVSAGFLAGDTLNFTNQHGIAGSYDAAHGVLTLTGTSSVANYRIALDSITYSFSPTNGDPTGGGGDTARTISWTVTDGATSHGGSAASTSTLHTVHVAPTVTAGGTATFDGGGSAVTLDGALTVSDADSNGNLAGATVTISSGFIAGDVLNFSNQNGISGSYNGATGVLTLTGTATLAHYRVALDLLTYSFSPANGDPTNGGGDTARAISWTVTDGGTSHGSSAISTSTLDVVHVAPSVTPSGIAATFTGGGAPVALDGALTVGDVDSNGNLAGATVTISSGFIAGDVLTFANQNGISGSYDAAHGVLTLTGLSSIAHYRTALDSVTYSFSPTNGDPTHGGDDASRTVSWTVKDGSTSHGTSATAASTLDVVHVAPTIVIDNPAITMTAGTPVLLDPAIVVTDTDSPTLTGATVTIVGGHAAGDLLALNHLGSFADGGTISASYSDNGVLTLTGRASIADYRQALSLVNFSTAANVTSSRSFAWTVTDGNTIHGQSVAATSTLHVVAKSGALPPTPPAPPVTSTPTPEPIQVVFTVPELPSPPPLPVTFLNGPPIFAEFGAAELRRCRGRLIRYRRHGPGLSWDRQRLDRRRPPIRIRAAAGHLPGRHRR